MEHIPVLLNEAIDNLNIKKGGVYVDATLGGGGHSSLILQKLNGTGHLYAFDVDDFSIEEAKKKLSSTKKDNYTIIKSNFSNLKEELNALGVLSFDGIIYDLGVSSFQFDIPEKGFSYNLDAKLDMRMDDTLKISAWDIVNKFSYEEIRNIIYRYGEDNFAPAIAKAIVNDRKIKPIDTTFELVAVIKKALPMKELSKKGHPAKKTFQALRVAVNHELDALSDSLNQAVEMLNKDGRIAVIDFEPLEDKIVKDIFRKNYTPINIKGLPVMPEDPILKRITKKPILPSEEELERNRRSHSAMLRVVQKA
ncbi:MAG: 16S rRNA (cytosine(1402)-N(4))-methyltransferase RsmH [Bacillales bacterium]|nr:16S rRNA (cytosine(1402)-N(4))-methyltransferase RsmH [Bacillales bacterium]